MNERDVHTNFSKALADLTALAELSDGIYHLSVIFDCNAGNLNIGKFDVQKMEIPDGDIRQGDSDDSEERRILI